MANFGWARSTTARGLTVLAAIMLASLAVWQMRREPQSDSVDPGWAAEAFVLAGDGIAGMRDDEPHRARFSDPFGVAVSEDGTVYVADAGDVQRIRGISPEGRVFTVAGAHLGFADGVAHAARFNTPSGLAIDRSGTLYVADTGNNAIRRISRDGRVSTLAGDGTAGHRDGPAHEARFNGPIGVAVDTNGRVIVADTYNDRIRAIDSDGTVRTLAGGSESGAADGPGAEARFHTPCGVAIDGAGAIHVADTGNGLLRVIDVEGRVTTRAWSGSDGFARPLGIAAGPTGDVYITDERGRIVEVRADGETRTLAGSTPGFRDGPGSDSRFRSPSGIAVATPMRLVVGDTGNALVRLVAARSRLDMRAPASPLIAPHFDSESFGWQPLVWPVVPQEGPFEIAGTLGEARGSEGFERFHAGVDVRIDEGTRVHAVRDGVVANPIASDEFGSINEWLRIGSISYVHIRAGRGRRGELFDLARFVPTYDRAGGLVGMRVKRGARFTTGDVVGTVNPFNHVHLSVGWPGEEQNPLRFRLPQFEDTVPPTIAPGGVHLYDDRGRRFEARFQGRLVVSGRVQVVVDAWDQANGNRPNRRLGLYDLGYEVLNRDRSPAPGFETLRRTLRFDRLSVQRNAARVVYAPGSGIPFYGRRRTRFLYIVTNTFRDGVVSQGFWDTSALVPGDYVLRVWAADIRGNAAFANRDVPVTVVSSLTVPSQPPRGSQGNKRRGGIGFEKESPGLLISGKAAAQASMNERSGDTRRDPPMFE